VADEVLYSGEHARDQIGVLDHLICSRNVLEQEASFAMDEEDFFYTITDTAREYDLTKGAAGTKGLNAPLQGLNRESALQGLINRLDKRTQCVSDRFANCFSNYGKQRISEDAGIASDRDTNGFFDNRVEDLLQLAVTLNAERDCFG